MARAATGSGFNTLPYTPGRSHLMSRGGGGGGGRQVFEMLNLPLQEDDPCYLPEGEDSLGYRGAGSALIDCKGAGQITLIVNIYRAAEERIPALRLADLPLGVSIFAMVYAENRSSTFNPINIGLLGFGAGWDVDFTGGYITEASFLLFGVDVSALKGSGAGVLPIGLSFLMARHELGE